MQKYFQNNFKNLFEYDRVLSIVSTLALLFFLVSEIQSIYFSNPAYFSESLFRYTNIFYFLALFLVFFFLYKRSILLLIVLLVFYFNFFFKLKRYFQTLVFAQLDGDRFLLVYGIVFFILLLVLAIFFFIPSRHVKVLAYFFFFYYVYDFAQIQIGLSNSSITTKINPAFKVDSLNRNLYILLFDEYPSYNSYKENFHRFLNYHCHDMLMSKGFSYFDGINSNYPNTERSVTSFLTATLHDSISVNNVIDALGNNIFTSGKNYSFYKFSIFDDINRKNSLVTTQFFRGINSTMSRYFAPFIISMFSKRGVGNFTNYNHYHTMLIEKLKKTASSKDRFVVFAHFYTPHYYPRVIAKSLDERLLDANYWMKTATDIIHQKDSSASVIVLSDHGNRFNRVKASDHLKCIFYYKNLSVDTLRLSKFGLYKFAECIRTKR